MTLGGVQVEVNGVAAPLSFVSPQQVNFQVPANIITDSMVVRVASEGVHGPDYFGDLLAVAPGIFLAGPESLQGAVGNEDSTLNSAENPAAAGAIIQIYATGLGPTEPAIVSGHPASVEPLQRTLLLPQVLVAGQPAEVLFSGLAPGFAGLNQVNARIPAATAPGAAVPLQIHMGGYTSNTVTIAVKSAR
jgi:uncharacterized protein (TIGR03437 family)